MKINKLLQHQKKETERKKHKRNKAMMVFAVPMVKGITSYQKRKKYHTAFKKPIIYHIDSE